MEPLPVHNRSRWGETERMELSPTTRRRQFSSAITAPAKIILAIGLVQSIPRIIVQVNRDIGYTIATNKDAPVGTTTETTPMTIGRRETGTGENISSGTKAK